MLQLNKVGIRQGIKLLFENASFAVHSGQRLGLIGINGSGKSSLFSLILGDLEIDSGDLRLDSTDAIAHVSQQSPHTTSAAVEFVMDGDIELRQLQTELALLEPQEHTARVQARLHQVHERLDQIDAYSSQARASRLLSGLGFSEPEMSKSVNEFSGGWRMRLNLAQALMCRSDLLLLDEPTNHLDLPAILWLERWLKAYEGKLLVISHDRDFLDGLCTHIAHIEHQSIQFYTGNYSQFEKVRSEHLALQQAMHKKQQREIGHIQSYVDRFRYQANKAKQAQSRLKMLERMTLIAPAHVDSQFEFNFFKSEQQPEHLLSLDDVDAGYGQSVIVNNVRLSIQAGNRIGLLGVNGAGKSTLIKALVDGSTLLSGERVLHRHTRIGYFAQHQLELLSMDCTPLWHVQQQVPEAREQELRQHLGKFGFRGERIDEPVQPFSGGEKARLVLAMLILKKPNLLLMDEPTNHLDLEMRHALSMALVEYSGALLVISHDRHLLSSVCDELYIVHAGQLLEFRESLDAYPAWLREQESQSVPDDPRPEKQLSKKELRQIQAQRRQQLQPLMKQVKNIEHAMAAHRMELEILEKQLNDEDLYSDPQRQSELAGMVQKQGGLRKELQSLEVRWLEASEALDLAQDD
ncbi:MAG: ATP-binding cassette subfamily F protein 3 [Lysobacterales bacterium]|jgi:ATP-binding cassette subfamily F protein 3